MPVADEKDQFARAEAFADNIEVKMRELGFVGDYFCDAQRKEWRQHAVRSYLGQSPDPTKKVRPSSGKRIRASAPGQS